MLGYVTIETNDFDRALGFYDQVLAPLGATRLAEALEADPDAEVTVDVAEGRYPTEVEAARQRHARWPAARRRCPRSRRPRPTSAWTSSA